MTTPRYPKEPREVFESPIIQGVWESIAYNFNFANCGVTTITGETAAVYELLAGDMIGPDVTADVMPNGSATVNGLILTTPPLTNLTAGQKYAMYGRVTHDGGQKTELLCRVFARA